MTKSVGPSSGVRAYCEARGFSSLVRERGFPYLLKGWAETVGAIEAGYDALLDEYLNDVDGRRIIDELATHASDAEWATVECALPALDGRFVAVTRPVPSCVWGDQNAAKYGYSPTRDWWYYRVPVNLSRVKDPERWP